MGDEPEKQPEKALNMMAEDTRFIAEGIEAEVRQDVEKAKGGQSKRPWWKVWART
jgi:hypothetical protein